MIAVNQLSVYYSGIALLNNISFNINLQILTIFLVGIGLSVIPSIILKAKTSSEKISKEPDEQTMTIVSDSHHNNKKKPIYNMQHYKSKSNGKNKQVSFVEKIAK